MRPEETPAPGLRELLHPARRRLTTAICLQAIAAVMAVVPLAAVAELARTLLTDPVVQARAWTVAAVAAAAPVAWLVLSTIAGGLAHYADLDVQLSVRRQLIDRLGRVPLGWFTNRGTGGIGKAVQHDVDAMHHMVAHALPNLTSSVITPLATLAYLFWVDWLMTLVLLIPVAIGVGLFVRAGMTMESHTSAFDEAQRRLSDKIVEFVEGIAVVKMFSEAKRAHRQYATAADAFATSFLSWVSHAFRTSAVSELALSPVTMLLTILIGGMTLVSNGHFAAVDLLPFAVVGLGLSGPLQALHYYSHDIENAGAAATRVGRLLATPVLPLPTHPRRPESLTVQLSGVAYAYDDNRTVLNGIDLTLKPGTITAVVGPSGSGKSTVAKLLPRFFDPTAGTVTIGGVDLRDIAPVDLYRMVSFVLQDAQLLDSTVRNNIRLAKPEADDDTVRRAAQAAAVHDRIEAAPHGYDSVIGTDVRFSGGEAQRICIARALLADAPIVVLDEATAHADAESEALIQDSLSLLAAGRTVLVVAHRLASIVGVDHIVVLDEGRVAEQGAHAELLTANGRYADMWRLQEQSDTSLVAANISKEAP